MPDFAPLPPCIEGIRIDGIVGRGGTAVVYAAHHEVLSIPVAVKVLLPAHTASTELDRALYEARLMARLDHPNLLRVYGAGRRDSLPYIVLEYMDGGTLAGYARLPA